MKRPNTKRSPCGEKDGPRVDVAQHLAWRAAHAGDTPERARALVDVAYGVQDPGFRRERTSGCRARYPDAARRSGPRCRWPFAARRSHRRRRPWTYRRGTVRPGKKRASWRHRSTSASRTATGRSRPGPLRPGSRVKNHPAARARTHGGTHDDAELAGPARGGGPSQRAHSRPHARRSMTLSTSRLRARRSIARSLALW